MRQKIVVCDASGLVQMALTYNNHAELSRAELPVTPGGFVVSVPADADEDLWNALVSNLHSGFTAEDVTRTFGGTAHALPALPEPAEGREYRLQSGERQVVLTEAPQARQARLMQSLKTKEGRASAMSVQTLQEPPTEVVYRLPKDGDSR